MSKGHHHFPIKSHQKKQHNVFLLELIGFPHNPPFISSLKHEDISKFIDEILTMEPVIPTQSFPKKRNAEATRPASWNLLTAASPNRRKVCLQSFKCSSEACLRSRGSQPTFDSTGKVKRKWMVDLIEIMDISCKFGVYIYNYIMYILGWAKWVGYCMYMVRALL